MPEEQKYTGTHREDFNDTSKPFNVIPEYKDLQKKRILENENVKYKKPELLKTRDSEDFKDNSMGQYD